MSSFRIPRREVEARLQLEGGEEIAGRLFAPRHGPHGEPGTIEDRLSDTKEPFLPLVRDDGTVFVNSDWILTVAIPIGDARLHDEDGGRSFELTFRLAGGAEVSGTVNVIMPPEESRLLDYLNTAPRFIAVKTDHELVLVNRTFIARVAETG